jgi:hypothetical protein
MIARGLFWYFCSSSIENLNTDLPFNGRLLQINYKFRPLYFILEMTMVIRK